MRPPHPDRPADTAVALALPLPLPLALLLALPFILSLQACDAQDPPRGPESRDSAGIQVVTNDPRTRPDLDAWTIDPEAFLQLGGSDGGATGPFHRVTGALRTPEGLVVADAGSGEIRWFDSAGTYVATAGGEGEGPGEFRDLSWLGRAPDGGVLAWDRRLRRLSLFDDGAFVRDATPPLPEDALFPEVHGALANGTVVASPGPVYVPENEPGVQRPPMPIWLFPVNGSGLDTLGPFPGTAVNLRPARGPGWIRTEVPFGPTTLVATSAEAVVVGDNASYELRWIDRDGGLVRIARVPETPREVSPEDVERELERRLERVPPNENIRAGIRASYRATPAAEAMPAFHDLRTDAADRVWVERDDGWDVLDPRGVLVATVRVPNGLRITDIGADFVVGVRVDTLGVEYVQVHPLTKPPGG